MTRLAEVIPLFGARVGNASAPHEPYRLDPAFERMTVFRVCDSPRMWAKVGRHMDPAALADRACVTALESARMIATETGRPPANVRAVIQRAAQRVRDGKITIDDRVAMTGMLVDAQDDLLDIGEVDSQDQMIVDGMRGVLQRSIRREIARVDVADMSRTDNDLTQVEALIAQFHSVCEGEDAGASRIGVQSLPDLVRSLKVERVGTGILEVDGLLRGGMPVGSLGTFLGRTGAGKSMALVQCAVAAALRGKVVHVITGELSREQWETRVLAHLFAVPIESIRCEPRVRAALQDRIEDMVSWLDTKFALYVERFAAREDTPTRLFEKVDTLEQREGCRVDVLVCDYADELRPDRAVNKDDKGYIAAGDVYAALRGWSERGERVTWTATQATRGDKKRKGLDVDDVSDSITKARVADLIVTINPEQNDNTSNKWGIAKNRHGPDHIVTSPLPADFATARCAPVVAELYPEPGVDE